MRIVFTFAILLAGPAQLGLAETSAVDVFRKAVSQSPKARAAEASSRVSAETLGATPSFARPKIDAYGNLGISESHPAIAPKDSDPVESALGLKFTHSLYDFGKTSLAHDRASIEHRFALAKLDLVKREVERDAAKEILEASRLAQSLDVLQALENKLKSQFGLVERQYRSGMKSRKDYLRFLGDFRRIQRDVQRTKVLSQESLTQLRLRTGLEENWARVSAEVKGDLLSYEGGVGKESIFAQMAELELQLKQAALSEARSSEGLELALVAEASYGANGFINSEQSWSDADGDQWSLMMTFNYNLIDFGMKRHRLAAAVARFDEGSANLDQSRLDRAASESKSKEQWAAARTNYQSAKELLKLEEESFAILESEYKQGRLSYIDYMQGFQNLSSAKTGAIDAGFGVRKALVELIYLNGGSNEMVLQ